MYLYITLYHLETRAVTIGLKHAVAAIALCLICACAAMAQNLPPEMANPETKASGPHALSITLENAWKPADASIAIPSREEPNAVSLQLPARPIPQGKITVLRFRTRRVSASFGGWNNFLRIEVNGQRVEHYTAAGGQRILNRKGSSVRTSDVRYPNEPYFKRIAGNPPALLTPFSHTWDAIEPRFTSDREELYWYVLDISDLVKPGQPATLTFINTGLAKYFKKTPAELKDVPLLVDSVEVGEVDEAVRDSLAENLDKLIAGFNAKATIRQGDMELAASATGALRLRFRGEDYFLRSGFSEPGARIGFNGFNLTPSGKWAVAVSQTTDPATGKTQLLIVGRAKAYAIERRVVADGPFVRIADAYINTSGRDLGVTMTHDLIAAAPGGAWWLSGQPDAPMHDRTAANPTLHLSGRKTAAGVAIKDSVMRAQMSFNGGRRKVTVVNDHFGLAKDARYTVEWQLYAGGTDYWEFVNAVRKDWNANHTLPGMFSFWRPETEPHKSLMEDTEKLRAYLKRKPIDVFAITPWFEYYYKPQHWQPRSVYKATVQETLRKLKAVQPDAKVIACIESFLYYAPESFFKGTLPKYWTDARGKVPRGPKRPHQYSLSEEATRVVDATPWRDSVFRDAKGNVQIDLHYAGRYEDGGVNLLVYPTLDNYWQTRFLDMLDFLLDDCGLDGVYIDSFTYYYNRTHDRWDGHTVDVHPGTGEVRAKYARLGLLTADARRQWVKAITDRGKICFVNGKRATAELQDMPHTGFMEAEWTFEPFAEKLAAPRAAQAQMSAPLALGIRPTRWEKDAPTKYAELIQRAVIAYLRHGALYCHYSTEIPEPGQPGGGDYGILRYMYPFTPVELHEGWVVGKERILTAVSGDFFWAHPEKPVCLRFDIRGMPLEGGFTLTQTANGWRVALTLDDWRQTAVIMARKNN